MKKEGNLEGKTVKQKDGGLAFVNFCKIMWIRVRLLSAAKKYDHYFPGKQNVFCLFVFILIEY